MEVFDIPPGNDTELGTLWGLSDSQILVLEKKINQNLAYAGFENRIEVFPENELISQESYVGQNHAMSGFALK